MNDIANNDPVEAAFETVLQHPAFSQYTREELRSCDVFCDMIRQSEHEDVIELQDDLQEIACATDVHNEATGFLSVFAALGGGFEENPVVDEGIDLVGNGNLPNLKEARDCFSDIPVDDAERFIDWVIGIPAERRSLAHVAAMDALVKRVVRIPDKDYDARFAHHQVSTILYYALADSNEHLEFANFACENLDERFNVRQQIPARLWQAFCSRPEQEVEQLIKNWWGPRADIPHDFFIALEWQREEYFKIHKGKRYHDAVAEYILSSCEPGDPEDDLRSNNGIEALQLDPFLAEDFYEALKKMEAYRWLDSHDILCRAAYLNELFVSAVLDRQAVLSALDHGIAKQWDKPRIANYKKLREHISA
jgi:hypothetical protein